MLAICHTSYSLQTGVRSPQEWVDAAVARGYSALAIADVNGLYGAVHFYQAAIAQGLQPLIGATLGITRKEYCVVLAGSRHGYTQLCRLLTTRHLDRRFSLSALPPEEVSDLLFLTRYPAVLDRLRRFVPADHLFRLPRAVHTTPGTEEPGLWDVLPSVDQEAPIPDAWHLSDTDNETWTYLTELRQRSGGGPGPLDPHPGERLPRAEAWCQRYPQAEAFSQRLCRLCRLDLQLGVPRFPQVQLPMGESPETRLRGLCTQALNRRYTGRMTDVAAKRLALELEAICHRGFAAYFLLVYDLICFAQTRNIPVEVRGSAASSIVSHLLGFTHCCPLDHDLLFERFLNPGRRDCPDIDIDIADTRRDELINYCYRRWGDEQVAMIATVQTYQTRSAVRDAGRILGLPLTAIQRLLDDGRPVPNQAQLQRIAERLMGLPRHLGVHCGGVVISPVPLTDLTPMQRAAKGMVMTHYDKDQVEAVGLVKMDLLGNSGLSVISQAQAWLSQHGKSFLEPGPRYDYKVRRLFATGDTLGIYQCESPGMRQLCQALKPTTPKQTAVALSLIRPGPSAAGMKEAFIRRHRGLEPVTYKHPRLADFLGSTYGVMLFQEDVMNVAVHLAGYSLADADLLRRAISKDRNANAFVAERHRFIFQKAAAAGVEPEVATEIWQQVTRFASYAYCKAHASVYGRLAWLTARLKCHHPQEFYAAILNSHKSMYPKRVFVWDAIRHGIPILPPDIRCSELGWAPNRHGVLAGLELIKGLRLSLCRDVLNERRRNPFTCLQDMQRRVRFKPGELERLILVGACRCWGSREDLCTALWRYPQAGNQGVLIPPATPALPSQLESELRLTGIPFSAHPVTRDASTTCCAMDLPRFVNREVTMLGILDATKELETADNGVRNSRLMSFITLEDSTGMFEAVLFPEAHAKFGGIFRRLGPYRIRGNVVEKWGYLTVDVQEAEVA